MFKINQIMFFCAVGILAGCSNPESNFGIARLDKAQSSYAPDIPVSEISFRIEPIKNMPGNQVDELNKSIFKHASNSDFRINRRLGSESSHVIKGTVVAIGDSSGIEVIYAFDILKSDGERVYRFGGQEFVGGTIEDPWTAVGTGTINKIAEQVAFEVNAWLSRS